jgi:lysophospholipase L1-like esterase
MPTVAKIYCFGDSNTQTGGYPECLRDMLTASRPKVQWQVQNGGIFGCSVSGSLPPMGDLGNMFKPSAGSDVDAVLMMLGTNDAVNYDLHFRTDNINEIENQFSDRFARLVAGVQKMAPSAKLMIVTLPPLSSEKTKKGAAAAKAFQKVMLQIAGTRGIKCIDCFSALEGLGQSQSLQEDGVHITNASGRLIASTILPHILSSVSGKEGNLINTGPQGISPISLSSRPQVLRPKTVSPSNKNENLASTCQLGGSTNIAPYVLSSVSPSSKDNNLGLDGLRAFTVQPAADLQPADSLRAFTMQPAADLQPADGLRAFAMQPAADLQPRRAFAMQPAADLQPADGLRAFTMQRAADLQPADGLRALTVQPAADLQPDDGLRAFAVPDDLPLAVDDADHNGQFVEETEDFGSAACDVGCISPLRIFAREEAIVRSALQSFLKRASFVF